jgi:hypothetical protein
MCIFHCQWEPPADDYIFICKGSDKEYPVNDFIIWVYGDDAASGYNGVVVIGNHVSSLNINEKNGLKFTDFNRTLSDALANESILDMQGTVEALSRYYYTNGESFNGLSVAPEYQDRFDSLTVEAIEYYDE